MINPAVGLKNCILVANLVPPGSLHLLYWNIKEFMDFKWDSQGGFDSQYF